MSMNTNTLVLVGVSVPIHRGIQCLEEKPHQLEISKAPFLIDATQISNATNLIVFQKLSAGIIKLWNELLEVRVAGHTVVPCIIHIVKHAVWLVKLTILQAQHQLGSCNIIPTVLIIQTGWSNRPFCRHHQQCCKHTSFSSCFC